MKFIFCLIGAFLMLNCQSQTSNTIKLNPYKLQESIQVLSDVAIDLEYIKLETNPQSVFGTNGPIQLRTMGEYIIIAANSGRIILFDNTGRYINTINHRGKGPGEYLTISKLLCSSKSQTIFILDERSKRILEYDIEGILQSTIDLDKEVKFRTASWLNDNIVYKFYGKQNHGIRVINTKGEIINEIDLGPRTSRSLDISYDGFSVRDNKIIYSPHPHFEILEYSKDLILLGRTEIIIAKNPLPPEYAKDDHIFHNNITKYNNILHVSPVREGFMFFTLIKGAHHFVYYNSQSGAVYEKGVGGMINDIDNGPSYDLKSYFSKEKNYAMVESIKLIEYSDTKDFKQKTSELKTPNSKFDQLISTLKIDDNPVLVIGKIK